ncbi:hypothetical protein Tco_0461188 [Tanacetum coccineum]
MGDDNPIRTLGDYSRPRHEGYQNTIELPDKTMWCLRDPTSSGWCKTDALSSDFCPRIQTNISRIFLNLIHLHLGGSYYSFLAQFFPSGRTIKLQNDILMFQQHQGHVHVERAYIDLNSPLNVMTRMQYNWIMRKQLEPREDPEGIRGISNFTRRIKGMHIFIGNFTYVKDFMVVEDISSIIDPRLLQGVLGKPFVEISNMTHDLSLGVVKFTNGPNEVAYKMPHKIEQFSSLSDVEKEHTKLVYLRNEEDKRRGVYYVMNKILRFYKKSLELGPEYLIVLEDEGGVRVSMISVVSILEGFTDESPFEENDDLFDLESKTNDWKKILYDALNEDEIFDGYHDSEGDIHYLESLLSDNTTLSLPSKVFLDHDPRSLSNDLKIMVKIFDPGIHETNFSPTYVSLTFEDRHYLSFTYVIRTFLPYFTYPVIYPFPLSSGSEDIIFDPGISAFHFSLEPVAFKCPMEVCSSTCFIPNFTMIWGESS